MTTPKTNQKHPYAEILIAIAEGREVQFQNSSGKWMEQNAELTIDEIAAAMFHPTRYRVKPSTININGYEVPEPIRVKPKIGSIYFFVDMLDFVSTFRIWANYNCEDRWLKAGLLHSTEEAATIHLKALLSFTSIDTIETKEYL